MKKFILPLLLTSLFLVSCGETSQPAPATTSEAGTTLETTSEEQPTTSEADPTTSEETSTPEEPKTVTFTCDEHVKVLVFKTQFTDEGMYADTSKTYNGDTGEECGDPEEAQINFELEFDKNYELDSLVVTPTDGYNKVKGPEDTEHENGYRITKISQDIEVTITSKKNGEVTSGYAVTFIIDEGIDKVITYASSDLSDGVEGLTAETSDGEGTVSKDASAAQISFEVVYKEGYGDNGFTIDGDYNKLKGKSSTGKDNTWRVTKVASDITIALTSARQTGEVTNAWKVTYECDEHSHIEVYNGQDYETAPSTATFSYTTNEDGDLVKLDGQVNIKVVVDDGYTLDSLTATKGYKNIKGSEDTGIEGVYRITKIKNDITVTVTTK